MIQAPSKHVKLLLLTCCLLPPAYVSDKPQVLLGKQRRGVHDCERAAELFRAQIKESEALKAHLDLADALNCHSFLPFWSRNATFPRRFRL